MDCKLKLNKKLSSRDVFINEIMLKASQWGIEIRREEVVDCIDVATKAGIYINSDVILNALYFSKKSDDKK